MGTWIEIHLGRSPYELPGSRSLRGNVDRNSVMRKLGLIIACRSLRGNVDRNLSNQKKHTDTRVVPYVGTWIEIRTEPSESLPGRGRSLRGNVDRNSLCLVVAITHIAVVPYVGTWIEIFIMSYAKDDAFTSFPTWERG